MLVLSGTLKVPSRLHPLPLPSSVNSPPASPLGGGGHSDEDSEVVEGKAGGEAGGERSSGLSKRATRSGQGMEVD